MIRDILIKAAEDVQQGMWCQGHAFYDRGAEWDTEDLFRGTLALDHALQVQRCAVGSLALAAMELGESEHTFIAAIHEAEKVLQEWCPGIACPMNDQCTHGHHPHELVEHNDQCLVERDGPFEAGQQLAEIFRAAADRL